MEGDTICEKCGQVIPRGTADCPNCRSLQDLDLRRESLLLISLVLLGVLFVITGFAVKLYHARERSLGGRWYTQGENNLQEGKAQAAVLDFRTALLHASDNPVYQLRLAQALVSSNRLAEARSYLLRLWESNPADGQVNLEMAHVAMKQGNAQEVIRYFHNAIDGVWQNAPPGRRRALRQELCEYLIAHDQRAEALAELMALSSETPENAALRTQVASLFLEAQDYDVALEQYKRSLGLDRRQPEAWAGAGEAAFQLGDYRAAREDLAHAISERSRNPGVMRLYALAGHVLQMNPFDRRVPAAVRRRRVIAAFNQALKRLASCAASQHENLQVSPPQTGLQKLYATAAQMKPGETEQNLRRNPDLVDTTMQLVFQVERTTAGECGPPQGANQALLLIAQSGGSQ
ncbi:MAG: tetratricopeptide repeat protein [Terriglobia bacterium]